METSLSKRLQHMDKIKKGEKVKNVKTIYGIK